MKSKSKIIFVFITAIVVGVISTTGFMSLRQKSQEPIKKETIEAEKKENGNFEKIAYLDDEQKISVQIPESWDYEKVSSDKEDIIYEIHLYPETKNKEKYISLSKNKKAVGVCGTGLTTENIKLKNQKEATVGYYHGENSPWEFIQIDNEEHLFSYNIGLSNEEAEEGIEIIKTIQYE